MTTLFFGCFVFLAFSFIYIVYGACTGCSGLYGGADCDTTDRYNSGYTLLADKVYACRGLIQGGLLGDGNRGMTNPALENICASNYEICTGIWRLKDDFNFVYSDCDNILNNNEFFAAKVTSDGEANCHWTYSTNDRDDIWGCAKISGSNGVHHCSTSNDCQNGNSGGTGDGCAGVLNARMKQVYGNQPFYPQSFSNNKWGADTSYAEFETVGLGDIQYGGVKILHLFN